KQIKVPGNPDFWIQTINITLNISPLDLMALHGFLCLALRHPGVKDHSRRPAMIQLVKNLGQKLVKIGALTSQQIQECENTEAEEGSIDFKGSLKD
ncbi:MAG: hypothetical protein MPEBLZ_00660, partial [Candidatus Methanoperedens nitroreducens]